jgi:hypothetical protein
METVFYAVRAEDIQGGQLDKPEQSAGSLQLVSSEADEF